MRKMLFTIFIAFQHCVKNLLMFLHLNEQRAGSGNGAMVSWKDIQHLVRLFLLPVLLKAHPQFQGRCLDFPFLNLFFSLSVEGKN